MSWVFRGFSTRRDQAIPLPIELFTEVLAQIRELADLKVLLSAFRLIAAKEIPPGKPRAVSWQELSQDETLRAGLAALGPEQSVEERLDRALERAVSQKTLLHLVVQRRGHTESWYLIHTAANRQLLEQIEQGDRTDWDQALALEEEDQILVGRATIFELYEQNIGVVTPMLADDLERAAQTYPPDWIEEAFREAVAYNRRSWRYIQAILERWAQEGRGERAGRREQPLDMEKYTRGKYAYLLGEQGEEAEPTDRDPHEKDRS